MHSKGNYKQDEKKTLRMRKKIIENEKNWQRINLLNIQVVQYQETNQHNKKLGRKSKQTFLQRHTDVQETHEKMLNISHY